MHGLSSFDFLHINYNDKCKELKKIVPLSVCNILIEDHDVNTFIAASILQMPLQYSYCGLNSLNTSMSTSVFSAASINFNAASILTPIILLSWPQYFSFLFDTPIAASILQ